jgi:hypothetical protein
MENDSFATLVLFRLCSFLEYTLPDSEATMPVAISAKSVMDSRGTKFIIMTEYPPEKQKMMEDKLFEEAAKHGIKTRGPVGQMGFVFTLDEALEYFKGLKEIQNMIESEERKEPEGSALD